MSRKNMVERHYNIQFNTPAFLGNADQSGQWRTPPFKAALRQWWRVAVAKKFDYDHHKMREAEGRLFGHAWLASDVGENGEKVSGRKSLIRIRLNQWDIGKMDKWVSDPKISHPEVESPLGGHLYLGYGALSYKQGSTFLGSKDNARKAIKEQSKAVVKIAAPETDIKDLDVAMQLMNLYGTLGGRSRNGWGSVSITGGEPLSDDKLINTISPNKTLDWCLEREWAVAIGRDEKGLFEWTTGCFSSWEKLMTELAKIKIDIRTHFKFTTGKGVPASVPELRHWLSYPVTNHSVKSWGNNKRLPNSLRFKVRRNEKGQFYGVVFHMPCLPPAEFRADKNKLISLWQEVHRFLDQQDKDNLTRSAL